MDTEPHMAFYTKKGDGGTTKTLREKRGERVSKSSCTTEALGTMDELNSLLGICKEKSKIQDPNVKSNQSFNIAKVIHNVQKDLFIVQAELAGADKTLSESKVRDMEVIIDSIEKKLPPITSFFISGGTERAATLDFARTVARRAERRVVEAVEKGDVVIGEHTQAFLNRLSSLLYALARLENHESGITEEPPDYA